MNSRILSVVGMFVVSCFIGYNMLTPIETIQAKPVLVPSPYELPFHKPLVTEKKSVDEIEVEVDLATLEVSVKGTTDAKVNVKTKGEPKPLVKYRTKVVKETIPTLKSASLTHLLTRDSESAGLQLDTETHIVSEKITKIGWTGE